MVIRNQFIFNCKTIIRKYDATFLILLVFCYFSSKFIVVDFHPNISVTFPSKYQDSTLNIKELKINITYRNLRISAKSETVIIPDFKRSRTTAFEEKISCFQEPVTKNITLLLWTDFFRAVDGNSRFKGCLYKNCEIYTRREKLSQSSAVIFNTFKMKDIPKTRHPCQLWIGALHESPLLGRGIVLPKKFNGVFNLTATYSRRSEILFDYGGKLKNRKASFNLNSSSTLHKGKTKLVSWMVSNCKATSKRLEYVRELQKFIPVDIYGKCGLLNCSKRMDFSCFEMLERDYYFYLSLKNSICDEYISRKIYGILYNAF